MDSHLSKTSSNKGSRSSPGISLAEEYHLLHRVAQVLQTHQDTDAMLQEVMRVITRFEELRVESKAGVFLADPKRRVLSLFATFGQFSAEFLEREKEVPYGDCLCGRAAESGQLLTSESCFTDARHERRFQDMTPHGHYILPLKTRNRLVGVMFLYTATHPTWYLHKQEVLLSIGGLIADAIDRNLREDELRGYRNHLEDLVQDRTVDLTRIREQLRNLNQRLRTVQEEEKQRIAREVHDELGQSMTALAMDLAWTKKRIDPSHAALVEKIEGMARLVEDTLERTQRIATELRPHVLDVMGLSEALQWQSRQFTQRTGIPCRMELDAARRDPDTDKSTALFRIFQETLTNVSRHAKASLVTARFHLANGWFELAVTDDGIGIPPGKLTDMASLGLMGIRERALALGGAVDIGGHPGGGSTVTVRIPAKGP